MYVIVSFFLLNAVLVLLQGNMGLPGLKGEQGPEASLYSTFFFLNLICGIKTCRNRLRRKFKHKQDERHLSNCAIAGFCRRPPRRCVAGRQYAKSMLHATSFWVFCACGVSAQVANKGRSVFLKDFKVLWLEAPAL